MKRISQNPVIASSLLAVMALWVRGASAENFIAPLVHETPLTMVQDVTPENEYLNFHPARSDDRGIYKVSGSSLLLMERIRIDFLTANSSNRNYGIQGFDRTLESSMLVQVSGYDFSGTEWITEVRSGVAQQDIGQLSAFDAPDRKVQRSYALAQALRRNLGWGTSAEIFAGVANCMKDSDIRWYPYGGLRLTKDFDQGHLTLKFAQLMDNEGAWTGMMGAQLRREMQLEGRFQLNERTTVSVDARVAKARTAFATAELLNRAPVVSAQGQLEVLLTKGLYVSAGYGYRKILSDTATVGQKVPTGHLGMASVTFKSF